MSFSNYIHNIGLPPMRLNESGVWEYFNEETFKFESGQIGVDENENPLGIMIISHGSFSTKLNKGVRIEEEIRIPKTTMYSFAVPGEASCYPPQNMIGLAIEMKEEFDRDKTINNAKFFEKVKEVQLKQLGTVYESKEWSGEFSDKPGFTGSKLQNIENYFEKKFESADPDLGIPSGIPNYSGVYVFYKKNAFISDFYAIDLPGFMPAYDEHRDKFVTFTNILNFFVTGFNIGKFYVFDSTCGTIYVPGVKQAPKPVTREQKKISYNIRSQMSIFNRESAKTAHATEASAMEESDKEESDTEAFFQAHAIEVSGSKSEKGGRKKKSRTKKSRTKKSKNKKV